MSAGRVLVIVPAHDEEESLPRTLAELRAVAPDLSVVVVDDASDDDTAAIARAAGVTVLRHPVNLGVLGALLTGFRWAVDHGYEVAVQFDADGQHDPRFLATVVDPVLEGRCDIAIGSRYVVETGYRAPFSRRMGMRLFSRVVQWAIGQRIHDTTSGFRAYGRRVLESCRRDVPRDTPDAPLLITLSRRGFRLAEVPVVMRERTAGRSFYTLGKQLWYPYTNLLASLVARLRRPV